MSANILVTMEHDAERNAIAACMENVGYTVVRVDTFHKAMDCLRKCDFDLLVTDVHLQNGGSVFDFLRWVKGDPHMRGVPFVCFSAEPPLAGNYLSDGVRTAARSLGAARYIAMEKFDATVFMHEIEWLIPENRTGNYYSGIHDHKDNAH
ncbi:MAG: response regulator [Cyanobacteria bacterium REEB67]|nr:response regulator [Cyanobacteria bacterium REEB67]